MNQKKQRVQVVGIGLVELQLMYPDDNASRFRIFGSYQNVWIPNKCLDKRCNVIHDIAFVFRGFHAQKKIRYAIEQYVRVSMQDESVQEMVARYWKKKGGNKSETN